MRSSHPAPLALSDYSISPEQGFLPSDPLEQLPDSPTLNHLAHELPKLLSARKVRQFIDGQRQLLPSIPATWRDQEFRAAMRILSFAGHAYVWEVPERPAATLPAQLAQPWYAIALKLGRPPGGESNGDILNFRAEVRRERRNRRRRIRSSRLRE